MSVFLLIVCNVFLVCPGMNSKPKQCKLYFTKMTQNSYTPVGASRGAAGFDLFNAYDYIVPPGDRIMAKTDIQFTLPENCYGRIAARSGLALNEFIGIGGGVIDRDYCGNVGVIIFNFNKKEFKINKGDRIA